MVEIYMVSSSIAGYARRITGIMDEVVFILGTFCVRVVVIVTQTFPQLIAIDMESDATRYAEHKSPDLIS